MNKYVLYGLMLCVLLSGCESLRHKHHIGAAVEIGQQALYWSELDYLTASAVDSTDSAAMANRFIRQWATDILEYNEAKDRQNPVLEELVEDYRRSVYVHEYESKLVARYMDTYIPDSVIQQYYEQHAKQFILHETILKGILIVLPNDAPNISKVKKWMADPDEENLEQLEKYAYRYGSGYELFMDKWHTANELLIRLPINPDNFQNQLQIHDDIHLSDSIATYLLHLTDKQLSNKSMPLDYATEEIRKIILNQRQIQFLKQERDKLYDKALKFNKIRFYEKE